MAKNATRLSIQPNISYKALFQWFSNLVPRTRQQFSEVPRKNPVALILHINFFFLLQIYQFNLVTFHR